MPSLLPSTVLLFLLTGQCVANGGGDRTAPTVIAPIRDLEPSLAASAAQGTAVAVIARGDGDGPTSGGSRTPSRDWRGECAVILTRSPAPAAGDASNLTTSAASSEPRDAEGGGGGDGGSDVEDAPEATGDALTPLPRGPVVRPGGPSRCLHVLHESSGLVCALTGFASDARHLVRVAARAVADHEHLYGGSCPSVHRIARDAVAARVRDAAFAASGRPFGTQALFVGNRLAGGGTGGDGGGGSLQLYTVDPAGGWRHWGGGGVAVGRKADVVRKRLHDALYSTEVNGDSSSGRPKGLRGALDVAMRAMIEAAEAEDDTAINSGDEEENDEMGGQYDAVFVLGGGFGQLVQDRCFAIDPDLVKSSYRHCKRQIADTKQQGAATS